METSEPSSISISASSSISSSDRPKTFSLTLGAPKAKSSPLAKKPLTVSRGPKRPHSSIHGSDNEEDQDQAQPQFVSTFDHAAGGAIGAEGPREKKSPLVIARLENRDWREESARRRGQNLLPPEVQVAQRAHANGGKDGQSDLGGEIPQTYGLSFVEKGSKIIDSTSGSTADDIKPQEGGAPRQKTDDELALEALTSSDPGRKSNLVLPALESSEDGAAGRRTVRSGFGLNEDDAFRSDILSRPDSATLDDYAAVPVEDFGAALLRGMGWKDGDVVGKRKDQVAKARVVERRPALLGIGAKEVPGGVGDEIGAWGKAIKGKRRVETVYSPVVLRNAKTGEMLTEEELKRKMEDDKRADEEKDWRERRDKNLRIDSEKKDRTSGRYSRNRDHHTEADRTYRITETDYHSSSSSRNGSSRRRRSRSSENRHRRSRDHEDRYSSRREKDEERHRRDRDDDHYDSSPSRRSYRDRDHDRTNDSRSKRREEKY